MFTNLTRCTNETLNVFALEAYWSVKGELHHGTIYVTANTIEEAEKLARKDKMIPSDPMDHSPACDNNRYRKSYYDIEPLTEEE